MVLSHKKRSCTVKKKTIIFEAHQGQRQPTNSNNNNRSNNTAAEFDDLFTIVFFCAASSSLVVIVAVPCCYCWSLPPLEKAARKPGTGEVTILEVFRE